MPLTIVAPPQGAHPGVPLHGGGPEHREPDVRKRPQQEAASSPGAGGAAVSDPHPCRPVWSGVPSVRRRSGAGCAGPVFRGLRPRAGGADDHLPPPGAGAGAAVPGHRRLTQGGQHDAEPPGQRPQRAFRHPGVRPRRRHSLHPLEALQQDRAAHRPPVQRALFLSHGAAARPGPQAGGAERGSGRAQRRRRPGQRHRPGPFAPGGGFLRCPAHGGGPGAVRDSAPRAILPGAWTGG